MVDRKLESVFDMGFEPTAGVPEPLYKEKIGKLGEGTPGLSLDTELQRVQANGLNPFNEKPEKERSFGDLVQSYYRESPIRAAGDYIALEAYESSTGGYDPGYSVRSDTKLKPFLKDLTQEEIDYLEENAGNEKHAFKMLDNMREDSRYRKMQQSAGIGENVGAAIVGTLMDPISLMGTGYAAARTTAMLSRLATLEKTARSARVPLAASLNASSKKGLLVKGAVFGGVESTLYDMPSYLTNMEVDEKDVAVNAMFSAGLAGPLNTLFGRKAMKGADSTDEIGESVDATRNSYKDLANAKSLLEDTQKTQFALSERMQVKADIAERLAKLDVDGKIVPYKQDLEKALEKIRTKEGDLDEAVKVFGRMAETRPDRGTQVQVGRTVRQAQGQYKALVKDKDSFIKREKTRIEKSLRQAGSNLSKRRIKAKALNDAKNAYKQAEKMVKDNLERAKREKKVTDEYQGVFKDFEVAVRDLSDFRKNVDTKELEESIKRVNRVIERKRTMSKIYAGNVTTPDQPLIDIDRAYAPDADEAIDGGVAPVEPKGATEDATPRDMTAPEGEELNIAESLRQVVKADNDATEKRLYQDSAFEKGVDKFLNKVGGTLFNKVNKLSEKSDIAKWVARNVLVDPAGSSNGKATAAEVTYALQKEYSSDLIYRHSVRVKQFKETGAGITKDFDDAFYSYSDKKAAAWDKAVEKGDMSIYEDFVKNSNDVHPAIRKFSEEWDESMNKIRLDMQEAEVRGAENLIERKGYVPRLWSKKAIVENIDNIDAYKRLLSDTFRDSFSTGEVKLSKAEADEMAEAFFTNLLNGKFNVDKGLDSFFDTATREDIKSAFKGVSENKVMKILQTRQTMRMRARSSRVQRRTRVSISKVDPETGRSLSDLVETDVKNIGFSYANEMAGNVGLAKRGIKSKVHFEFLRNEAKKELALKGVEGNEVDELFDDVYNVMMNRPVTNAQNRWVRLLGDYVNLLIYGATGLVQVAETFTTAGYVGAKNLFRTVPELKNLVRDADGKIKHEVVGDLERAAGVYGKEHVIFSPSLSRMTESINNADSMFNKMFQTLDSGVSKMNDIMFHVNGMNFVRDWQTRMFTVSSVDMLHAYLKKGVDVDARNRLNSYGFEDELISKLEKAYKDGKFITKGNSSHVTKVDVDLATQRDLGRAVRNFASVTIQEKRPGEEIMWTAGNFGQIMTKALAYPLLALTKQSGRNLRYKDRQSLAYLFYTMFGGATVYSARQYAYAEGMDSEYEKRKHYERAFSEEALVWGTLGYAAPASVLTNVINMAGGMGVLPSEFTPSGVYFGRSGAEWQQDMESQLLGASPVTSKGVEALDALRSLATYARGGNDVDGADVLEKMSKVAPYNNHPLFDYLPEDLD